jgi:hypothetical protein
MRRSGKADVRRETLDVSEEGRPYLLTSNVSRLTSTLLGAIGLLAFGITLAVSPQRAWANLLLGNVYFVSIALFGIVFVAMNAVFNAGWAVLFRRVPEAFAAYLPIGLGVMLVLWLALPELYPWARPEAAADPHLSHKRLYLNVPFFCVRTLLAFGIWIFFADRIRRHSRQQDADGSLAHTRAMQSYSAAFLILFALTFTWSSFDWIMSLEPTWYSTVFPLYMAAGLFLGGTAAMITVAIGFQKQGLLTGMTEHHRYQLARLLAATACAWVFVWFSQYLLIYYTNIPEEAVYYARRFTGSGRAPFQLTLLLNWAIPLALLIPPRNRRSSRWLLRICTVVLVGRWLDLYLLIVPAVEGSVRFGPEVLTVLGFVPLFLLPLFAGFRKAEPVPRRDPYLVESVSLRV